MKINPNNYWVTLETATIDAINSLNGVQFYLHQLNLVKNKDFKWDQAIHKTQRLFSKSFGYMFTTAERHYVEPRNIEAQYERHIQKLQKIEDWIAQYLSGAELNEKVKTDCVKSKSVNYTLDMLYFSIEMLQEMLNKGHKHENYATEKKKIIEALVSMMRPLKMDTFDQRNGEWQDKDSTNARLTVLRCIEDLKSKFQFFSKC